MNQILTRVESLGRQIRDHQDDQDKYERFRLELDASESAVRRIESELSQTRERFERVRLLLQAWEDWIALGDSRERLKRIPEIDSFPEDGVKRLDAWSAERRSFRDQVKETASAREEEQRKLAAVETDEALLSAADDIRRLDRRLNLHEQGRQKFSSLQTERELDEQTLAGMLSQLGEEWDEDKLRTFDLSVPVREEMDDCCRAFEQAKADVRQRQLEWDQEKKQHKEARQLVDDLQSQLEKLPRPSETFDAEGVRKLQLGRESYERASRDFPGVERQCKTRLDHLDDTLRKLGPNWDEHRLRRFDTSLAVQKEVSAHQQRLSESRSVQKDAVRRADESRQAVVDAEADLVRAEEVLSALPEPELTDETALAQRRHALRTLRSQLNDTERKKARLDLLEERKRGLHSRIPWWIVIANLVLGIASLLGFGIGGGEWIYGTIVIGFFLVAAGLLAIARRMSTPEGEKTPAEQPDEAKRLADRHEELAQEMADLREELDGLESRLQKDAEAAGFDDVPEWRAVEETEADIERHVETLQRRRPAEQKRDDARENLSKAKQAMSRAQGAATETTNVLHEIQEQWRQWLAAAGLPETLTPEDASNVLARLDAAREQLKAIESDRERIDQMKGAIREYEDQVKSVATTCRLDGEIPREAGEAVDLLVVKLHDHERRRSDVAGAARRLQDAQERAAPAQSEVDKAGQLHRQAVDAAQQCRQQWTKLLERLGLRTSLAVESAPQMLQSIERAHDQLVKVEKLRKGEENSRRSLEDYCREVRTVAMAAGRPEPPDEELPKAVSSLAAELDEAEESRRDAQNLEERISGHRNRLEVLQNNIDDRQREIDELLQAAGATDEEAFRRRAADFETRRQTRDQMRQLATRLRKIAGGGDALELLDKELERATPEGLNAEQIKLDETIKKKNKEQTAAARERGRLEAELEQLESSEELSRLRIEEQAGRAEFATAADQWSVLKIAAHLVDRAREKYERERRPAVLKEAERYFALFTGGNYNGIRAPLGGDHRIIVMAPDGSTKEIDHLSRGTAEQLYLSLRFGFVREFVRRSEPLPLVFDDILVNFDPGRARAAAEAMLDLSKSLQMLLFTCHPATVDLMKDIDNNIPVYGLKNGRLSDVD